MVQSTVSESLAKVPEDADTAVVKEDLVSDRVKELEQRIGSRYPDNFVLRDELCRLARLMSELARAVEGLYGCTK